MTSFVKYDFAIIGSGFGGSVSALRLAERGYTVAVIEKGRRFAADDFPKTNWQLSKWMWLPALNWRGIFKMTFFRHVTVLSGVGVGGGSLVYANTLPHPPDSFFESPSWSHLADWKSELAPHYDEARRMLGATKNPLETYPDELLKEVAVELGREEHFDSNPVAVYFGEAGETVPDPYFDGEGPERTGCIQCGACMTGCRHGAKNTLDKNYLYFAEKRGVEVLPDTEVSAVRPLDGGGYRIEAKESLGWFRRRSATLEADNVVFSGGVLGSVDLLLRMKKDPAGLPNLSDRLGESVRTNSESLIGVISPRKDIDFSKGIAITSILHTDEHSHVEPVRYGSGSGFWRILTLPHAPGRNLPIRVWNAMRGFFRRPLRWFRTLFIWNYAKHSMVLLYMRTLEGTLALRRKRQWFRLGSEAMGSAISEGEPPDAFMPEATAIAESVADKVDGVTMSITSETLMGTPSTAHILGGCCIGESAAEGVIDTQHRVHGYDGLFVVDGSAVSANPGVNPSLTITAMAERAMSFIPPKA